MWSASSPRASLIARTSAAVLSPVGRRVMRSVSVVGPPPAVRSTRHLAIQHDDAAGVGIEAAESEFGGSTDSSPGRCGWW